MFAGSLVLKFTDYSNFMNIVVFATETEDRFKVVNDLCSRGNVTDVSYVNREQLKNLWINSIINGYVIAENRIFPAGILDCFDDITREKFKNGVTYKKNEAGDLIELPTTELIDF